MEIKERLPSQKVLAAVFVTCMIPVHIWAIINAFHEVPAWILRMSLWEVISVIAYTQVFALFESLVLVILILIAAFILPGKLLRDDLAISSALIMLVLTTWLIILHTNPEWISARNFPALAVWSITFLVIVSILIWYSKKWKPVHETIVTFIGRLSILAALYVVIDAFSVLIILFRNINF